GSAAVMYAESIPVPESISLRQERDRKRRIEEEYEKERIREQKHSMRLAKLSAFNLMLGIMLFGSIFYSIIYLQNSISNSMRHISALETEISDLKAKNAATESRISTSTNLNSIKESAVSEMGMMYAGLDQIVYYSIPEEDYMDRYE
ncbi:MAG: hypothetical protein J6N76_07025, partial [Lachnospiraceae bacterium]|nr:hypothetical protein [Lachnospiraceae bacterium]